MSSLLSISEYSTLVFDCDGVVLDSNKVKTDAFYRSTFFYGEAAALAMVEHHVANGGISRYKKFAYFLEQIVPGKVGPDLDMLLEVYADHVHAGLHNCAIAPGLEVLRQNTPNARWLIVSGGDQTELRDVFARRGIAKLFDGGIFGSPDSKDKIFATQLANRNIKKPCIFLGDSKYDYAAAEHAALDFVFIGQWTDVKEYKSWCVLNNITWISTVRELCCEHN